MWAVLKQAKIEWITEQAFDFFFKPRMAPKGCYKNIVSGWFQYDINSFLIVLVKKYETLNLFKITPEFLVFDFSDID